MQSVLLSVIIGIIAMLSGVQLLQWSWVQHQLNWFSFYQVNYLCFVLLPVVVALGSSLWALCLPSTLKPGFLGANHRIVPVWALCLGLFLAALDIRPSQLPGYWQEYYGQQYWVYGQVVDLPKQTSHSTRFTFRALCWRSDLNAQPVHKGFTRHAAPDSVHTVKISDRAKDTLDLNANYRSLLDTVRSNLGHQVCDVSSSPVPEYFRRLQVYDYSNVNEPFRSGRRGWLKLKIKMPRAQINPAGGDVERWYFVNHLGARASLVPNESPHWMGQSSSIDDFRDQSSQSLQTQLRAFPLASRLIPALLLGDRRALLSADWTSLNRVGLGHLIAISGLHVGFAASIGFFVMQFFLRHVGFHLRLMNVRPLVCWAWLGAWCFGCFYSALAGFSLPTLRALFTLTIFCLWRWFFLNHSLLLAWLFAAAVLLGFSPRWLFDTSFVLSFAAVGVLIVLLGENRPRQVRLAQAWRLQLGLGAGLIPMNVIFFQQISWFAPVINFICVPIVGFFIVPFLLIAIGLQLLGVPAGESLLFLVAGFIERGGKLIEILAQQPFVVSQWMVSSFVAAVAIVTATVLWLLPTPWRLRPLAIVLVLLGLSHQSVKPINWGGFRMTVLDVGQGQAVAIQTREHFMIYDAGPAFGAAENVLDRTWHPYLRYFGLKDIDLLLSSHMDEDHAGAAQALLANFPIKVQMGLLPHQMEHLGVNKASHGTGGHIESSTEFIPCVSGQHWQWDGVVFEVLYPEKGHLLGVSRQSSGFTRTVPERNLSCVLKVTGLSHSVLLPGDINRDMERAIIHAHKNSNDAKHSKLKSDVLLVPHHGSKTSSSTGLLHHVAPSWAVASHGFNNAFGHPHSQVVNRYVLRNITWFSTAQSGAVTFFSDPNNEGTDSQFQHWRFRRARLWRFGLNDEIGSVDFN